MPHVAEPEGEDSEPAVRTKRRSLVLEMTLAGLALTIVLNFPFAYRAVQPVSASPSETVVDFDLGQHAPPRMAGWPLRYYVSYPATSVEANAHWRFALAPLAINVSLIALAVLLVTVYRIRRPRRDCPKAGAKTNHQSHKGTGSIKISIADALVITLVVAAGFGWWRRLDGFSQQQSDFAAALFKSGAKFSMDAWVPTLLASVLPDSFTARMREFRSVRIEQPDPRLVDKVANMVGLQSLRLGGDGYDLRLIESQVNNPHLVDLRIAGASLTGGLFKPLRRCLGCSRSI